MEHAKTRIKSTGKNKSKQKFAKLSLTSPEERLVNSEKLALQHSRYLQSVLDPWNEVGAKIPDEITTPSFPMNAVTKIALNCLAGAGGPPPGPSGRGIAYIVGSTTPTNTGKYLVLNPQAATPDTYQTVNPAGSWVPGGQLTTVAQSTRPVSAGLFVNVQGSFNDNQGRIIVGFLPPFDPLIGVMTAAGSPVTATQLDNAAYSTSFPVTKLSGRAVYLPLDDIARSYLVSGSSSVGSSSLRGVGTANYGVLFALVDGVSAASPPQIEFILSENFECVPINAQVNIVQPEVSSSDPIEMALASNFIAARPTIAAFQPVKSSITGTPLSGGLSRTEHQRGASMMDKILGGLLTGARVAAKVAPVAAELLAAL